ncbi:MAG: hypothetical protein HYX39_09830 [Bacteroidetes bacterium]|nr:hypothetical protein [Bacteroidota bacterium]
MKTLVFYIAITLFLFSTVFAFGQSLKIEIFNRTNYDLDSVSIGEKFVGTIEKDSSIIVTDCKRIILQDRYVPFGPVDGVIKDKRRNSEFFGFCGNGKELFLKGEYKFDIYVSETKLGYRLYWDSHK